MAEYIQLRGLSDEAHEGLKDLAAAEHRSVNAQILVLIERAVAAYAASREAGEAR